MLPARLALSVALPLFASTVVFAADGPSGDYGENLRQVYGSYQGVLARRDACGSAFPDSRGSIEKAFTAWRGRNRNVIAELDQRFAMMIHSASKDEKDYAKNVGKYEGAVLRQREEVKQTLLKEERSELETLCKSFIVFMQSADSDLEKEFTEELAVVRKQRPLARK